MLIVYLSGYVHSMACTLSTTVEKGTGYLSNAKFDECMAIKRKKWSVFRDKMAYSVVTFVFPTALLW